MSSSFVVLSPHFTRAELSRLADYLQVAQAEIFAAARSAEHRRSSDALIQRLDAHASDIADMRARIESLAAVAAV